MERIGRVSEFSSPDELSKRVRLERSRSRGRDETSSLSSAVWETITRGVDQHALIHSQSTINTTRTDVATSVATNPESSATPSEVLSWNDSEGVSSDSLTQSTYKQLIELEPQSKVAILPNRQIEINGQLKILPGKLAQIEEKDLKKILELTRKINEPAGITNTDERVFKKISQKYYIQFEYKREKVEKCLKLLGIEHIEIFQNMNDTDKDRILKSIARPVVEGQAPDEPSVLQFQAVHYAQSQNVSLVSEFVRYYEFYITEFLIKKEKMKKAYDEDLETEFGKWKQENQHINIEDPNEYQRMFTRISTKLLKSRGFLDNTTKGNFENLKSFTIKKAFCDMLKGGEHPVASEEMLTDHLQHIDEFFKMFPEFITRSSSQEINQKILEDEIKEISEKLNEFLKNKNIILSEGWEQFRNSYVQARCEYSQKLAQGVEQWKQENQHSYTNDQNEYKRAELKAVDIVAKSLQEEMGFYGSTKKNYKATPTNFKKFLTEALLREMGASGNLRETNKQARCDIDQQLKLFIKYWQPLIRQSKVSLPLKDGESMQMLTPKQHEEIVRAIQKLARQDNLSFSTSVSAAYHTNKHTSRFSIEMIRKTAKEMQKFVHKVSTCISEAVQTGYTSTPSDLLTDLHNKIMQELSNQHNGQECSLARLQMKRSLELCFSDLANELQEQSVTHNQVEQRLRTCLGDLVTKWQEQCEVHNQAERYRLRIKSAIVTPKQKNAAEIAETYAAGQHDEHVDYHFYLGGQPHKKKRKDNKMVVVRVQPDGQVSVRTCY